MTITRALRGARLRKGAAFAATFMVAASSWSLAQTADPVIQEIPVSAITPLGEEIESRRGIVRSASIKLPADLFEVAPVPGRPRAIVKIPVGDGSFAELLEERRIDRDGRTVIFGRDRTQEHARFRFTRKSGAIWRGEIERDDEVITFTGARRQNSQVVFRLVVWQPSALPEERTPNEANAPDRRSGEAQPGAFSAPPSAEGSLDQLAAASGPVEIDVLVVYTPAAAIEAPQVTFEPIEVTIQEVAWTAGLSLQDQAGIKLNVHVAPVNYVETGDMAEDLDRLECPCDHKRQGVGANHLNEVFELWKASQADIVSLWIHSDTEAGYGNIMGNVTPDWAPRAVHVVAWDTATSMKSFDHELGHQFGARHNWEKDNTIGKPYIYNHGYVNLAAHQVTIMAYSSTCLDYGISCTRASIWSDPTYAPSDTWGVAPPGPLAADNARTLAISAPTVAMFDSYSHLVGCCIREGNLLFKTYRPGVCQ